MAPPNSAPTSCSSRQSFPGKTRHPVFRCGTATTWAAAAASCRLMTRGDGILPITDARMTRFNITSPRAELCCTLWPHVGRGDIRSQDSQLSDHGHAEASPPGEKQIVGSARRKTARGNDHRPDAMHSSNSPALHYPRPCPCERQYLATEFGAGPVRGSITQRPEQPLGCRLDIRELIRRHIDPASPGAIGRNQSGRARSRYRGTGTLRDAPSWLTEGIDGIACAEPLPPHGRNAGCERKIVMMTPFLPTSRQHVTQKHRRGYGGASVRLAYPGSAVSASRTIWPTIGRPRGGRLPSGTAALHCPC